MGLKKDESPGMSLALSLKLCDGDHISAPLLYSVSVDNNNTHLRDSASSVQSGADANGVESVQETRAQADITAAFFFFLIQRVDTFSAGKIFYSVMGTIGFDNALITLNNR